MFAQFTTPPDNSFSHYALLVLAWILTTAVSGWFGYRLGLRSQIESKKLEVKTNMLPMVERFVIRAESRDTSQWFGLRQDSIGQLLEPTIKLKNLLIGRKRKMLISAWENFSKITREDFHIPQYNEQGEPEMRALFLERLNALKSVVESI
jgi:hypothetical protein